MYATALIPVQYLFSDALRDIAAVLGGVRGLPPKRRKTSDHAQERFKLGLFVALPHQWPGALVLYRKSGFFLDDRT
jgi:hypothetical protein